MRIEVINTGSELLLGNVTNTHLAFLGRALFGLGLRVQRQVCVPDGPAIRDALTEAFPRADIVFVTGGLGPTSDDLTRDITAELLGLPLRLDEEVLATIRAYFASFGRPVVSERIQRQAQVPAGARVLPNAHGTAPGLYLPAARELAYAPHLFLLPGPPRELRPMFDEHVVPILRGLLPEGVARQRMANYRLIGVGESWVEERVGAALAAIPALEIGYCARPGEVDLRLVGGLDELARGRAVVLAEVGAHLLSEDEETAEQVLVHQLTERGATLAVAESCTGGLLASRITDVPGSSVVFLAGLTTYSNAAKTKILAVPPALIESKGAVSAEVAAAMAAGARETIGADFALSTTGIAGPGGGTDKKPVGTVYIALATGAKSRPLTVEKHFFPTDRETFKQRATQAAFDLLRRRLAAG